MATTCSFAPELLKVYGMLVRLDINPLVWGIVNTSTQVRYGRPHLDPYERGYH